MSERSIEYSDAVREMEDIVDSIRNGNSDETVWLLEHPPLYTAGTSAKPADLLNPNQFPVHKSNRGGQFTYHGPGQRVAYLMLDLNRRGRDVRNFVNAIEQWAILALSDFGVDGQRRSGRIGVWVSRRDLPPLPGGDYREDKIAAIGIRLRNWVSFHGLSINIAPELAHYGGIVPCGIPSHGVTSLLELGKSAAMSDIDRSLRIHFEPAFSPGFGSKAR